MLTFFLTGKKKKSPWRQQEKGNTMPRSANDRCIGCLCSIHHKNKILYIKRIKKQPGFGPKVSSQLSLAPQAPGVASRLEYCHPSLVIHSVHVDWVSLHRNLILIPKLWGIGQQTINHLTQRRELNPGNLHVAEHKNLSCFKIANLGEYCPFYSY